ncbi:MAG: TMEM165/GDT1 family protein [Candidatus Muiribacteriaceae bacterium]
MMIDLPVIFSTFAAVFLAELGDKTQLCAFSIGASKPGSWVSVFLGSSIALVLTSLIAALCGKYVGEKMNMEYVRLFTGFFFVTMGVFYIFLKK